MHKFLFVALLGISFFTFGQTENCRITYSGQVIDIHDQESVPYARVQIKELNQTVMADSNGFFSFANLCPGDYSFNCFHHIGCEPEKFKRTISKDLFEQVFIEFHFDELDEVTVEYTIFKMSTISVLKPSELEKRFSAGKTLGDLVKQIPGVNSLNTGSSISKPVIHGMHSNRVLVLNNGVRQEGQQWGSEHAPEIDPFLMSEVCLIRGASAVRYGSDAIAGVILTNPKKLFYEPGVRGEAYATAFSNGRQGSISTMLEGSFKKLKGFSWRTQGTFKQGGTLQAPRYYLKNTAMKEYNFSLNAKYEHERWGAEVFYSQFNTDLGIFSAAHIGNLTDLNKAFLADKPLEEGSFTYQIDKPKQHIEHEFFKASGFYNLNSKNRLVFQYGRQYNLREEYDRHVVFNDSIAALNLPAFQLTLLTHTADLKWEHQWLKNLTGEIGISYLKQGNNYQGRFFVPNFGKQSIGMYWLEVLKMKEYELEIGVRADRSDLNVYMYENKVLQNYEHIFQNISGSIGASRKISHHWVIRANAGTAWRAPSINELYSNGLHHGAAAIEIGNRAMKKELAINFQAGLTFKSRKLNALVDVYHNEIQGFINLKPTLPPMLTIKGAFPVFRYEQINARFSGVDLSLRYNPTTSLSVFMKGSMVRAFDKTNQYFVVGIPADRVEPGVDYKLQLKKDQKMTFHLAIPLVRTQDRVEANSDYVAPPKGYVLVNAQIAYEFKIREQNVDISLEANNLLNQSYRDYLNRFRYFSDEIGRNIALKIKVPFNIKKHEKNSEQK
ncbi:MAG: TonB-dependent receptor [Crocinitomicaceae bacterium]|nr:TonB-dependent receptor [Crocinitomicaceae bacterium]